VAAIQAQEAIIVPIIRIRLTAGTFTHRPAITRRLTLLLLLRLHPRPVAVAEADQVAEEAVAAEDFNPAVQNPISTLNSIKFYT